LQEYLLVRINLAAPLAQVRPERDLGITMGHSMMLAGEIKSLPLVAVSLFLTYFSHSRRRLSLDHLRFLASYVGRSNCSQSAKRLMIDE
jgi:hypothetical protein